MNLNRLAGFPLGLAQVNTGPVAPVLKASTATGPSPQQPQPGVAILHGEIGNHRLARTPAEARAASVTPIASLGIGDTGVILRRVGGAVTFIRHQFEDVLFSVILARYRQPLLLA